MAELPAEEIAQLEQRIGVLRQRLRLRETQIDGYGSLDVPPHIVLDKQEAERELRQAQTELRRLLPGPTGASAPYLGLLTFHEQDADRFFGREALVADLVERAERAPFLAVLGPSDSGKSSVVRAVLIPCSRVVRSPAVSAGATSPSSPALARLTCLPPSLPSSRAATYPVCLCSASSSRKRSGRCCLGLD
jgi:hypothetical protein